ncbi:kinesin-like protein KIF28 [Littorina saxatilis]|uniref:kinesin-like protein KIF28 n=1 Tax=Littorina saxatilis TaxID=31220 RepID=UPI0038B6B091
MENAASEVEAEAVHMRATVRVRPFSSREMQITTQNVIAMSDNTVTITDPETNDSRQMVFDSCFWSHDGFVVNDAGEMVPDGPGSRYSGQEVIFKDIGVPALEKAWDGYNACVIAYGSTGSGKSLTMLGSSNSPGLVHLCCKHLFSEMSDNPQQNYKVTFSLCEIYNETVVDLLSKTNAPLKIRTRPKMGPYVQDLAVMPVKSAGQTEELLQQGLKNRMIAATNMNSNSSRSHLIVTLHFNQFMVTADGRRVKRKSQLKFVDLAGSERASTTGATGDRLREGNMINRSLTGLASVINALANAEKGKRTFVPYRETSLTRLMQEALGGNCATTLIATVSPASRNYDETLSTLRFAHRAKKVSQKPVVNDVDVDKAIGTWKGKMDQMQTQMASAESEEEKINFEKSIEVCRSEMKKLELPWKEKDSKEKGGTWGSLVYNIHQPEFDTTPYLQNISEDAQLSGVVKHLIPQGHLLVGKSGTKKVSLELSGLGIQPWHAILVNTGSTMSIAPCSRRATVHVNGRPIHTTTTLNHLDHIKLGACEWFILVGFPSNRITGNPNAPKHMHEKCLTELAENHPLARQLQPTGSVRAQTAALLLLQEFADLLPKVAQAEALAAVFGKVTRRMRCVWKLADGRSGLVDKTLAIQSEGHEFKSRPPRG